METDFILPLKYVSDKGLTDYESPTYVGLRPPIKAPLTTRKTRIPVRGKQITV